MGYASERAAIEGRWKNEWMDGSPASERTPTAYENVPHEPTNGQSWVRLNILPGEGRQIGAGDPGNNTHRYPGVIAVQIFTPANKGTKDGRVLADHAADVFRNQMFDGVDCGVPYVAGSVTRDDWYQINLNVPFRRDEHQ